MNKTIPLSILLTFGLVISSLALVLSPPATFFEVQRDRKEFSLNPHESFVVITGYAFNINKITIELSKGDVFAIQYRVSSDYPTDIVNKTIQNTNFTLEFSTLNLLTINSTTQAIQGIIEIDYGIHG